MRWTGVGAALVSALALGALSTLGDWIWAEFLRDGAVLPGVVHGLAIFVAMAIVLGRTAGRQGATRYLMLRLPAAGAVLAGLFYPLAFAVGYLPALVISWVLMWLVLVAFFERARGEREKLTKILLRGSVAAVASGLAFWVISGIWTGQEAASTGYGARFIYWTFAFLPGFVAVLVRRVKQLA